MHYRLFTVIIILLIVAGGGYVFFAQQKNTVVAPNDISELIVLAQCLREHDITMYGSRYCQYCERQKKSFGATWDYVPYVECESNKELCAQKNIIVYPTWILADGSRIVGEQSFEKLANLSDCPVEFNKEYDQKVSATCGAGAC